MSGPELADHQRVVLKLQKRLQLMDAAVEVAGQASQPMISTAPQNKTDWRGNAAGNSSKAVTALSIGLIF